jgi:uncharacterized protein
MTVGRVLCSLLVWTALAGAAVGQNAPSADTLAAAKEVAQLLSGDSMAQMRAAITAQMWSGAIEPQLSSRVDAATLAHIRGEFERAVNQLSTDVMQEAPAIYARHFNAHELGDMLAFYKSPSGAKPHKVVPVVLTDISIQIGPRMQRMQGELNTRIEAIMRQHGSK